MLRAFAAVVGALRRNKTTCQIADQFKPALDREIEAIGLTFEAWFERITLGRRLYVDIAGDGLASLSEEMPSMVASTVNAAETVLRHEFSLLGSGVFVPVDAQRPPLNGYRSIDWYLDPVSGLRFPHGIPHREWNLERMRPGSADIKLPWELARCQHWPTLGQAWRLTGDDRFALEIALELDDFMQANPVGIGINWTCTMDVALRALNWVIGLALIKDCRTIDPQCWRRAYRHLFDHAVFVFDNLENKHEVTSNHFLSNIVGLYYLASVFADLPQAGIWNRFCRESLEREMELQVLDDGADYESSIPYHRLVTELFLGAARLGDFREQPLSIGYRNRLRKMVEFLASVLRPDGLMPQVGDADDGRVHILSQYGQWNPQDARHLFGVAGELLGERQWCSIAGAWGAWESRWWGFSAKGSEFAEGVPPPFAGLFPNAGLAIFRDPNYYLLITNGVVGTKGFGNHKHNDQLGFELHFDGSPLIVDPGSFVYTADPAARNRFRGTGYHNTLMIDDSEQNLMRPEWLFRLFEQANPEHLLFHVSPEYTEYHGRHSAYRRLGEAVSHERRFRLFHANRLLLIADFLDGSGCHRLRWHFHFAPGLLVADAGETSYLLEAGGVRARLASLDNLKATLSDAWYSPSYGVRLPCVCLDFEEEVAVPGRLCRGFAIAPEGELDLEKARLCFTALVAAMAAEPDAARAP